VARRSCARTYPWTGVSIAPSSRTLPAPHSQIDATSQYLNPPVVFFDIEDVEIIVQNIREGDFRFVDCLREKLGHDQTHWYSSTTSTGDSLYQSTRFEFKRNTIIADEYKDSWRTTAMTKFGAGVVQGLRRDTIWDGLQEKPLRGLK